MALTAADVELQDLLVEEEQGVEGLHLGAGADTCPLGSSAKVAAARPNPNPTNSDTKVICVYTYDWTDKEDVQRVRQELRQLGITSKIPYKADVDTYAGRYAVQGQKRISKYYE